MAGDIEDVNKQKEDIAKELADLTLQFDIFKAKFDHISEQVKLDEVKLTSLKDELSKIQPDGEDIKDLKKRKEYVEKLADLKSQLDIAIVTFKHIFEQALSMKELAMMINESKQNGPDKEDPNDPNENDDLTKELADLRLQVDIVKANFDLISEQAKLPLAELAGLKAAISEMKSSAGKEGNLEIVAGQAGAMFLCTKIPMLELLISFAEELNKNNKLRCGAVIVTNELLEKAYYAKLIEDYILNRIDLLKKVNSEIPPEVQVKGIIVPTLAGLAAGSEAVALGLDLVDKVAKLLKADKKIEIFSLDDEAFRLLGYFLEEKNNKFITNLEMPREEVYIKGKGLLKTLGELFDQIQIGNEFLTRYSNMGDDDKKKNKGLNDRIKLLVESGRKIYDLIDPIAKPVEFWSIINGLMISELIKDKTRLQIDIQANSQRIIEKWWLCNKIYMFGEIQVAYRIMDKDGRILESRVLLKASKPKRLKIECLSEKTWPKRF